MSNYNIVMSTNEATVVSEYEPAAKRSEAYQSEAALEKEFIKLLTEQGYEYAESITDSAKMIHNLRVQLEKLNNYHFTDGEWKRFFDGQVANPNMGIAEKSRIIQEDYVQVLRRDDGSSKNIYFIDKNNIHNNTLQVINQYKEDAGTHKTRYDVTVLVNGLPLVHIELKRRGVAIKEAFNQIERYQRDSFWADAGLFEYVQIFVISNGTNTKYYSNTTRFNHLRDMASGKVKKSKTSNSFEFTSFWADANNRIIPDLVDFTKTFFAKHTILNILTKYCVFTSEDILLVMRPYQIAACERILNRIEVASNYHKDGSVEGGGYIWHTTGSGKTLTSFKTAQLATNLPFIDKVLFVVDRKDLDYQTMKEYDRFEKGAANSNTSTAILKKQLEDDNCRIIITTIQKLSTFVNKNKGHEVYNKHVVIIFDECHRSQFGDMHTAIVKNFKKYHLFGFTGTPIFSANAGAVKNPQFFTTAQTFGDQLHSYTIVDAINDHNVLPFRVDYIKTMEMDEEIIDEQVWDIDREKAFMAPKRIELITEYILNHFDQKTYRNNQTFTFNALQNISDVASGKNKVKEIRDKQRINGFNSIFAVSSVQAAKLYYSEFKKQMAEHPEKALKIAVIYSYAANEEEADGIIDEENPENTSALDKGSRDFLDEAIKDYNETFRTSYSTDGEKFQNYYKDVSLRMKNKELDLLIVVNMFLTGFDATTLNTLWVDKNLKMHGLIQAFSRTNRILNSIKTFGNIVCFRNLQKRVDDAISLFGDKEAGGIVVLKSFNDYYYGTKSTDDEKPIIGYVDLVKELSAKFPVDMPQIIGEQNQKDFISLFGAILRMRNLLLSFDEFEGKDLISERDLQDYLSKYQDLRDEWKEKRKKGELEDINEDVVFEIELIKQIEVNIDYILLLVAKFHDSHCEDKELLISIRKAVEASPELRSKKDLIEIFLAGINDVDDVLTDWRAFIVEQKEAELQRIIAEENLDEAETRKYIENSFRDGTVKTTGTDIDKIMPKVSRFGGGNREEKKETVVEKLKNFFDRFFGMSE